MTNSVLVKKSHLECVIADIDIHEGELINEGSKRFFIGEMDVSARFPHCWPLREILDVDDLLFFQKDTATMKNFIINLVYWLRNRSNGIGGGD